MNNPFPTSVNIDKYLEDGKYILSIDGRRIGCQLAVDTLADVQHLLDEWWTKENNRQWLYGDVILESEARWGDEAVSQIIPDNDYAASTLANWSSVAKQYAHSERLYNVRWSVYAEVAYVWNRTLRAKLLLWAEETQATVQAVRAEKKRLLEAAQDAPNLNEPIIEDATQAEFSSDEISGIFAGNLRPLIRLFATWRDKVKSGKRYRLVLMEVE